MIEKNELKTQGLAFGRSLQTAFKVSLMYSVDHPAAEKALQQTYALLSNLLKQSKEFTFGFLNKRVLLNKMLTPDALLTHLETEFSKREIGAISFAAGITFTNFQRGVALLSTKPSAIVENGGIGRFRERNPIEGLRILPLEKKKTSSEDTVLEMDIQSYLTAQAILETPSRPAVPGLEMLFQSAGVEKSSGFSGTASEILELSDKAAQAALADHEGDLKKLVTGLALALEQLTPNYLLSSLPPGKESELRGRSAQEVAMDLVEDMTAGWAVKRLATTSAGPDSIAVEEEVLQALMRGLKATLVAERLLKKLARFIEQAQLPPEIYDRIRQDVMWFTLEQEGKHARLMQLERFTTKDFRRLVNYVQEMMSEGKIEAATQVTDHYFAVLDSSPGSVQREALERAPELLRAVAGLRTLKYIHALAERFAKGLSSARPEDLERHQKAVKCLVTLAQSAALYQDFELVFKIGLNLERSMTADKPQHTDCCGKALGSLLNPAAVERLVELYLEKRDDAGWARTATSLLRLIGPEGAEIALRRLEDETAAANRMRLIRLIGRLGSNSIEATGRRLTDRRWYVVRNACYILGDLGDPQLSKRLLGALRHPDVRVQQAAITAIIKGQAPGRAAVLAEALPDLQAQVLDIALDELIFLKDPASVNHVEQFVMRKASTKAHVLEKAIRLLATTPSERAAQAIGKVISDPEQALSVRKAALAALQRSPFAPAQRLLAKFSSLPPNDPLSGELHKLFGDTRA